MRGEGITVVATEPKRKSKMMTVSEKVKLLDKLKECVSYVVVAPHYNLNESTVCYIRKDEQKIRKMTSRTFNEDADKDRLTLLMCGIATGFMLKPDLIYKSKNPRALKNKKKKLSYLSTGCTIRKPGLRKS
uniref:DDE-1 domain-containing protein n=1 Tax=Hippocampus comes TaxID=109280 RepID=A0A3Q2Z5N5_HIPCM